MSQPNSGTGLLRANDDFDTGLRTALATSFGQTGFYNPNDDTATRNHYEIFGWPRSDLDGWDDENWLALYLRNAYARTVTDKPAETTWRDTPTLTPRNGDDDSDFTQRIDQLDRNQRLWSYAERVDRAAGIGQHGLLLIDTSDRRSADDWDTDAREANLSGLDDVTGYRPIIQTQIEEIDYGTMDSERWGKPVSYTLDLSDDTDDETEDDPLGSITVHWTRAVNVPATRLLDDEVLARPRMEPVLNNLLDIEKTMGAAAEAAYRAADYGLHINADPTEVDFSEGADNLAEELQRYEQDFQRYIRTQGVDIERLGGDIQDPSGIIETNLDAISAETGIPKKELRGNESGEVTGAEQDKLSYFGTIQERRNDYANPHIVRAVIDRHILLGILSRPDGGYEIEWPDLHELSESDRAEIQQQRSSVVANVPGLVGDTALEYIKEGADAIEVEEQTELPAMDEANPEVQAQFGETVGVEQSANQDVDQTPPQEAAENARRGLECVEEVETDAGQAKGRDRARQIIDAVENGSELSAETIADIASFDRHRAQGNHTVDEEHEGTPCEDNGFVAWKLWGGSAGVDWAQRVNESLSENATRFSEGDTVQTPQGLGIVTEVRTEDFTGKNDETVEASENSPTYVIGLQDARIGVGFYSASELEATDFPETDVADPAGDLAEQSSNLRGNQETTFGIPETWQESEKPARLILLDAWQSMGGTFEGARDELGSDRLAASMKDRVLQWEGWRKGG